MVGLVRDVRRPVANTRYTAAGRRAAETMPPETVASFGILVLQGLTVLVAVWATCTARQSLKVPSVHGSSVSCDSKRRAPLLTS